MDIRYAPGVDPRRPRPRLEAAYLPAWMPPDLAIIGPPDTIERIVRDTADRLAEVVVEDLATWHEQIRRNVADLAAADCHVTVTVTSV